MYCRSGRWFKARVEQQVDVRSYEVRTEDGKIFRRNRRHLRSSKEPACARDSPEPIQMPNQTRVSPSLNRLSGLRRPVPLWRYHHPRILEKWLVPRNLSTVPRLVKYQSSPHPPNQLTLQLPEVAECPDHQVILRTLLLPSDIEYHFFEP